jgi:threonyl-tRNA synthetase
VIHRPPFGSLERFTGLLIEHFEGKFAAWLAPAQVRVVPISEKTLDAAKAAAAKLADVGVRLAVDRTNEKVGAKIRNARLDRFPTCSSSVPRKWRLAPCPSVTATTRIWRP